MFADRVQRVLRAGRREVAAAGGAEKKDLRGRNRELINTNGQS